MKEIYLKKVRQKLAALIFVILIVTALAGNAGLRHISYAQGQGESAGAEEQGAGNGMQGDVSSGDPVTSGGQTAPDKDGGTVSGNSQEGWEPDESRDEGRGEISGNDAAGGGTSANDAASGDTSANDAASGDISGNDAEMGDVSGNEPAAGTVTLSLYVTLAELNAETGGTVFSTSLIGAYDVPVSEPVPEDILDVLGKDTAWHYEDGREFDRDTVLTEQTDLYMTATKLTGIYYYGQTVGEILALCEMGLELQDFFMYTAYKNFTEEDLEEMGEAGIELEDVLAYAYVLPEIEELSAAGSLTRNDEMQLAEDIAYIEEERLAEKASPGGAASYAEADGEPLIQRLAEQLVGSSATLSYHGKITSAIGVIPAFTDEGVYHGPIYHMRLGGEDAFCVRYGYHAPGGTTYTTTTAGALGFSAEQQHYMAMAIGWYKFFTEDPLCQDEGMTAATKKQLLMVPQTYVWMAANNKCVYDWDVIEPAVVSLFSKTILNWDPAMMYPFYQACLAYMQGGGGVYPEEYCYEADLTYWWRGADMDYQWLVTGTRAIMASSDPVIHETFSKTDAETGEYLDAAQYRAEFAVFADEACTVKIADCTDNGDGTYNYPMGDLKLDISAEVSPEEIAAGGVSIDKTYYVKETKAPYGYYLDPGMQWEIAVHYDGSSASLLSSGLSTVKVENDYQYMDIRVEKKDNESGTYASQGDASLDGAWYALYAAEDIEHPDCHSGVIYHKDELIYVGQVEDGSLTFSHLYEGSYTVVEVQGENAPEDINGLTYERTADGRALSAATGYLVDETRYTVTGGYDESQCEKIERGVTSYEQAEKAAAYFYKYENETGTAMTNPLEGAGFTVYLVSALSKAAGFETDYLRADDNSPVTDADGNRITTYKLQSILDAYEADAWYEQPDGTYLEKYDFREETAAVAKTYLSAGDRDAYYIGDVKVDAAAYYAAQVKAGTLTALGGSQYRVNELFSDGKGLVEVPYLPYGTYLVVESTTPKDHFACDPFLLTMYPDETKTVITAIGINDAVKYGLNAYQETVAPGYAVQSRLEAVYYSGVLNDEAIEEQFKLIKGDRDTFQDVLAANTEFEIYAVKQVWSDEAGDYVETPVLITQTVTYPEHVTYETFKTNEQGYLTLPTLLSAGEYLIREVTGPEGFWNDRAFEVRFTVTTDREYISTGESSIVNEQTGAVRDIIEIHEHYYNDETRGVLYLAKKAERLTGFEDGQFAYSVLPLEGAEFTVTAAEDIVTQDRQTDAGGGRTLWYRKGDTVAVFKTGEDGQVDVKKANEDAGVRLAVAGASTEGPANPFGWVYNAAGENDARSDTITSVTAVKHEGDMGSVRVELPLGEYVIEETAAPYGYVRNEDRFKVRFTWEDQNNQYVQPELTGYFHEGEWTEKYIKVEETGTEVISPEWSETEEGLAADGAARGNMFAFRSHDSEDYGQGEFYNEKVGQTLSITKYSIEDGTSLIPGVEFTVYTADPIYAYDGKTVRKLFDADEALGTAVSDINGVAEFSLDLPIDERDSMMPHVIAEKEGQGRINTGRYYIKETDVPSGAKISAGTVSFEASGDNGFVFDPEDVVESASTPGLYASSKFNVEIEGTQYNKTSGAYISKKDVTNSEELPGALLAVIDKDGGTVKEFISGTEPTEIRGLDAYTAEEWEDVSGNDISAVAHYTLSEKKPADGYATSSDIGFVLVSKEEPEATEDYNFNRVYVWDAASAGWLAADQEKIVMFDETTKVRISKQDIANNEELPGASLTVKDKDGTVVDSWVSSGTPHFIEKLTAGEEYTLIEVTAPDGYAVAEAVKFTVEDTGKIQAVVMKDKRTTTPDTPRPSGTPDAPDEPVPEPSAEAEMAEASLEAQTGEDANLILDAVAGIAFIAGGIAAGAAWRKKRKRQKREKAE